jgi:hypothetical protein
MTRQNFVSPGDVVYCPEGRAVSAGRLPDLVAYPERGIAWVATRDPDFPAPETGDKGIIARFELPPEE